MPKQEPASIFGDGAAPGGDNKGPNIFGSSDESESAGIFGQPKKSIFESKDTPAEDDSTSNKAPAAAAVPSLFGGAATVPAPTEPANHPAAAKPPTSIFGTTQPGGSEPAERKSIFGTSATGPGVSIFGPAAISSSEEKDSSSPDDQTPDESAESKEETESKETPAAADPVKETPAENENNAESGEAAAAAPAETAKGGDDDGEVVSDAASWWKANIYAVYARKCPAKLKPKPIWKDIPGGNREITGYEKESTVDENYAKYKAKGQEIQMYIKVCKTYNLPHQDGKGNFIFYADKDTKEEETGEFAEEGAGDSGATNANAATSSASNNNTTTTAPVTNIFGNTATGTTAAAPPKNIFGPTETNLFGDTKPSGSIFGTTGGANLFGKTESSVGDSAKPEEAETKTSIFGGAAKPSMFGNTGPAAGGSIFDTSSKPAESASADTNAKPSIFGTSNNTPSNIFGTATESKQQVQPEVEPAKSNNSDIANNAGSPVHQKDDEESSDDEETKQKKAKLEQAAAAVAAAASGGFKTVDTNEAASLFKSTSNAANFEATGSRADIFNNKGPNIFSGGSVVAGGDSKKKSDSI